jgi:hypothetical protein
MAEGMKKEASNRKEKERMREEWPNNREGEVRENENKLPDDWIKILENEIKDRRKDSRKENRKAKRIDKLESEVAKDRTERQDYECNMKEDKDIQDTKETEREMERKLEEAME